MRNPTPVQPSSGATRRLVRVTVCFLLVCLWRGVVHPPTPARALDPKKAITQYSHDVWQTEDGLPSMGVGSIVQARDGYLWFGTEEGVVRFDGVRFTVFDKANTAALKSNYIVGLYEDREGSLWIGTRNGGMTRYKDGTFTNYTTKDSLANNFVRPFYEDRKGNLWIGTRGGLHRLREGQLTVYTTKEGLSSNDVSSLYGDQEGNLWIGTEGGGLNRLKNGKFTRYTTKDGLFHDVMHQILEDGSGNLWMSCNKGIFRVSKKELNDFAEGKLRSITSVVYGMADGMKSNDCNGGAQPAGWKTRDGRLWFPTAKGVAIIDPAHIKLNLLPPPVIIEQVIVDSVSMNLQKKVTLSPGKEKFEFHYTGLSFVAPAKVKFKYQLEGFDKTWVDADTRRVAYYTNLPPGTYRFRVRACNNDGVWNETGASLELYLQPHFYQTAWFYALCVLTVVFTGVGGHRLRIRQLKAREQELVTLVAVRTRDLADAMTTIETDNARKTQELEEARALQLSMLPQHLPTVPHLDLAVSMQTATEVGGDYYDVHLAEDGTLTLAVGDATGHGLKAGIVVATAKSYFQTLAAQGVPIAILQQMATGLKNMHLPRLYMGLTVLQYHEHRVQLVGAGMPPIFLYRRATGAVEMLVVKGMPLGSPLEVPYQQHTVAVQAGDTLLLMSDGLPELFNPAKELLDYERIQCYFNEVAAQSAAEIVKHLTDAAAQWAAGRPHEDDITLFVVKVTG